MKPKAKSTGELIGKRFLTTKIKTQEETVSLFPLDAVIIGCDARKSCRRFATSLMTPRIEGWREREKKKLDLDSSSETQT